MIETNKIYDEDCRETIGRMDNDSIDCLVTSPPYWALRDYGEEAVAIWDSNNGCLHEWGNDIDAAGDIRFRGENSKVGANKSFGKDYKPHNSMFCKKCGAWRGSLGLEPDFNLYIKHLCDIFEMFKPKLKKTGTIWVNLGDTYASGTRDNNFKPDQTRLNSKEGKYIGDWHEQPNRKLKNYPAKSLCLIPQRFEIEMVNRGWIYRNEIIWHKPNCMPSSVKDRFTVDFEKVCFFVKSPKYYFEQQEEKAIERIGRMKNLATEKTFGGKSQISGNANREGRIWISNGKRNKRCVWTLPTQPNSDEHFAIYPDKLIEIPIKAGCPEGGIVYDPFGGSGTTAEVSIRLGRKFIVSEINSEYVYEIAEKRIRLHQDQLSLVA